jgi:hypothetical protein
VASNLFASVTGAMADIDGSVSQIGVRVSVRMLWRARIDEMAGGAVYRDNGVRVARTGKEED